jgi:AcrR family transcriptional regulator
MGKQSGQKSEGTATRRNLPAQERKKALLDAALELFSEKGMGITVQELADRVNVTQPLVHRYFPAKTDLLAAIFDTLQNAHWDAGWTATLTDASLPMEDRIVAFYGSYLPHIFHDRWYRGFLFAALEDPVFAQFYLARINDALLLPIISGVRTQFGFPGFADVPFFDREVELVWGMHSTLVYVGIRRYVYHAEAAVDLEATVRDQMRAYLMIAPIVMAEVMPSNGL